LGINEAMQAMDLDLAVSLENMFRADGPREKLLYRKGFDAGFKLAMEYREKGVSVTEANENASNIMLMLTGTRSAAK